MNAQLLKAIYSVNVNLPHKSQELRNNSICNCLCCYLYKITDQLFNPVGLTFQTIVKTVTIEQCNAEGILFIYRSLGVIYYTNKQITYPLYKFSSSKGHHDSELALGNDLINHVLHRREVRYGTF